MSAVLIDGRAVHYESYGRGPAVIFLHSWLDAWRCWVSAMEELSEQYRAYALDLWGFGSSNGAKKLQTLDDYTALLDGFVDVLGLSKGELVLVGHGLGAVVALRFAAEYPGRVSKLALVALPLDPSLITNHLRQGSKRLFRNLPEEVRVEAEKVSREVVKQTVETVAALGDLRPLLAEVNVPTLLIYGERDEVVKPPAVEDLDKVRPNLRAFVLPGGHFVMLDAPAKFNRLLLDFLAGDDMAGLAPREEWRRRTH